MIFGLLGHRYHVQQHIADSFIPLIPWRVVWENNNRPVLYEVCSTCLKITLSGQIIATSHDLTPNGGLVREIPLFQGNLGWWNIIIWPDSIDQGFVYFRLWWNKMCYFHWNDHWNSEFESVLHLESVLFYFLVAAKGYEIHEKAPCWSIKALQNMFNRTSFGAVFGVWNMFLKKHGRWRDRWTAIKKKLHNLGAKELPPPRFLSTFYE